MMELPSATFFRLAERAVAFPGVLQARLRKEAQDAPGGTRPATSSTSAPNHPAGQRWNLRERGGEAVAVASDRPSYLHEKMKARTP